MSADFQSGLGDAYSQRVNAMRAIAATPGLSEAQRQQLQIQQDQSQRTFTPDTTTYGNGVFVKNPSGGYINLATRQSVATLPNGVTIDLGKNASSSFSPAAVNPNILAQIVQQRMTQRSTPVNPGLAAVPVVEKNNVAVLSGKTEVQTKSPGEYYSVKNPVEPVSIATPLQSSRLNINLDSYNQNQAMKAMYNKMEVSYASPAERARIKPSPLKQQLMELGIVSEMVGLPVAILAGPEILGVAAALPGATAEVAGIGASAGTNALTIPTVSSFLKMGIWGSILGPLFRTIEGDTNPITPKKTVIDFVSWGAGGAAESAVAAAYAPQAVSLAGKVIGSSIVGGAFTGVTSAVEQGLSKGKIDVQQTAFDTAIGLALGYGFGIAGPAVEKIGQKVPALARAGQGFAERFPVPAFQTTTIATEGEKNFTYTGFLSLQGKEARPLLGLATTEKGTRVALGNPNFVFNGLPVDSRFYSPIEKAIGLQPSLDYLEKTGATKDIARFKSGLKIMQGIENVSLPINSEADYLKAMQGTPELKKASPIILNELDKYRNLFGVKSGNAYGSTVMKAQMDEAFSRTPHDLDSFLRGIGQEKTNKIAEDIAARLRTEAGMNVRISKEAPSLIEVKSPGEKDFSHLVDIHADNGIMRRIASTIESQSPNTEYLGLGFKPKAFLLNNARRPTMQLSESGIRKLESSIRITERGVGPEAHRLKDIMDAIETSRFLATKTGNKSLLKEIDVFEQMNLENFPELKGIKGEVKVEAARASAYSGRPIKMPNVIAEIMTGSNPKGSRSRGSNANPEPLYFLNMASPSPSRANGYSSYILASLASVLPSGSRGYGSRSGSPGSPGSGSPGKGGSGSGKPGSGSGRGRGSGGGSGSGSSGSPSPSGGSGSPSSSSPSPSPPLEYYFPMLKAKIGFPLAVAGGAERSASKYRENRVYYNELDKILKLIDYSAGFGPAMNFQRNNKGRRKK